jgi:hypothetical protein
VDTILYKYSKILLLHKPDKITYFEERILYNHKIAPTTNLLCIDFVEFGSKKFSFLTAFSGEDF